MDVVISSSKDTQILMIHQEKSSGASRCPSGEIYTPGCCLSGGVGRDVSSAVGAYLSGKARASTSAGRFCLQRRPVAGDARAGKPQARQPVGHQHTRGPARASIRWSEAETCAQRGIADRIKLPRSDSSWLSCGRFPAAVEPQPTRPQAKRLRRQFRSRIATDVGSCRQMRLDTGPT